MWNLRKAKLEGALAFLKIGHYGSVNATPWGQKPAASKGEPLTILNAVLPVASKGEGGRFYSSRKLRDDPANRSSR
jgi:hypothetical protein